MHTPCFPAFRPRLAALGHRTTQNLRQTTLAQLQQHLRDFLPAPLLSSEEDGPNSRDRVFNLSLTFECFVWQLLKPKTSCREVVRQVQTLLRLHGRRPIREGDSAYIQARHRLPRERLQKALSATAQAADHRIGSNGQLRGRPVKVVDGSTIQWHETLRNQKRYPQPTSQKPGCGFPVIRFVALLSLNSGAILKVMMDGLCSHDLRLFRHLWKHLRKGDIILGDRAFGEYSTLAQLPRQGVDVVARLHHQRKVDFRKAQRLAKGDGLFVWTKGYEQSGLATAQQWQQPPLPLAPDVQERARSRRGHPQTASRMEHRDAMACVRDPRPRPRSRLEGTGADQHRLPGEIR